MKELINFNNVARILNLRSWGVRGPEIPSAKKHVQFLNDLIFTADDVRFFYSEEFAEFYVQNNDFEHSIEFWFAIFYADQLAKSKTKIQFDNFLFYIEDSADRSSSKRNALQLYRALNSELRIFLKKILFLNEEIQDLEQTNYLKMIPIEVVKSVLKKEFLNEFSGELTKSLILEIQQVIKTTK
jgi:hypothetical protein